jgi:hypothetical protein
MTRSRQHRGVEPFPDGEAPDNHSGLLDALMEIGQERQKILVAMKEALLRGDDDEALERARELTGLPTKRAPNGHEPKARLSPLG